MPRGQADRPALRFFTSKARCARRIVPNFTRHTASLEVFGDGGTETLWLSPAAAADIEPQLPFAEQGLQSPHAGVPLAAAQCA